MEEAGSRERKQEAGKEQRREEEAGKERGGRATIKERGDLFQCACRCPKAGVGLSCEEGPGRNEVALLIVSNKTSDFYRAASQTCRAVKESRDPDAGRW
eukprot:237508-Hanusia_phi.AAC.1